MRPTPQLPPLEVYMLGLVDFSEVQQLQRGSFTNWGNRGGGPDPLRAPAHDQRGTVGSRAHIEPDDDALEALGIEVHWVNRGGGCVFHLPGQLAAYFAIPLDTFDLSLKSYLDRLHTAILMVLEEFDLTGPFRPACRACSRGTPGSPPSAWRSPARSPTMA